MGGIIEDDRGRHRVGAGVLEHELLDEIEEAWTDSLKMTVIAVLERENV